MPYITRDQLLNYPNSLISSVLNEARINLELVKTSAEVLVFLSHSHHDKDLIEYARILIASQGVKTYVDCIDPSMPPVTSPETARLLKEKIKSCQKFIMLASNNALESKWVPWELGFADSAKLINNVAILPVADRDGTWRGSEYVGIYPRIEKADNGKWSIFLPNDKTFLTLSYWLHGSNL